MQTDDENRIIRQCCEEFETRYIARFPNEPPTLICEKHFADESNLVGMIFLFDMKLKKEIPIPIKELTV